MDVTCSNTRSMFEIFIEVYLCRSTFEGLMCDLLWSDPHALVSCRTARH